MKNVPFEAKLAMEPILAMYRLIGVTDIMYENSMNLHPELKWEERKEKVLNNLVSHWKKDTNVEAIRFRRTLKGVVEYIQEHHIVTPSSNLLCRFSDVIQNIER